MLAGSIKQPLILMPYLKQLLVITLEAKVIFSDVNFCE